MPTVDELPAATSVSDTDEVLVSQSDVARKATRAQILSGVQPSLALPQNSLLGRISSGIGSPETILVGANLTIANGTISAPAAFSVSALPTAGAPQASDLVPVSQGGQNAAGTYATFMGGLSTIAGIDGSNLQTSVTEGVGTRRLADTLSDAITLECFGGIGDGVTDNTAALQAALATGRPIRLDGQIYIVNGPISVTTPSIWLGVPGGTIIRRQQVIDAQSWIAISGPELVMDGIIFDAASLAAADGPALQVNDTCPTSLFSRCCFINAWGATGGSGLSINCGAGSVHRLSICCSHNNAVNGIIASGGGSITVESCNIGGNTANGIVLAAETSCRLSGNLFAGNNIGIAVGNWELSAPETSTAVTCLIERNECLNNTLWGIAVSGYGASISCNSLTSGGMQYMGGALLARVGLSRLANNQISGGNVGIDARTSWGSLLAANHISGAQTAVTVAGCQNLTVDGNFMTSNIWAVDIAAIEPTLASTLTGPITISRNWIGFTSAQGGGIWAHDGVLGVCVAENDFNGWGSADAGHALWLHTGQAIISANRWNNQPRFSLQNTDIAGKQAFVYPDLADEALVITASASIQSLLTSHQVDTLGQITFVQISNGGAGYTSAQVTIAGSGHGASASAIVADGQVICIVVTNPGSGYGEIGVNAVATINGDGIGATATAYVGLPVIEGRHLRLACNCRTQFALSGSVPPLQSWTNFDSTIPAMGVVEFEGSFGNWRAVSFPPVDYLQPTGDGGAVLASVAGGNVTLRPSAGGALHIANGAEPTGYTSSVGRGAPTGFVAAPPGSDFRNLNGGAGNTFWVKQTGVDSSGWAAIG